MLAIFTAIKLVALLSYLVLALLALRSKAEPVVRTLFSIYIFGMSLWQLSSVFVNFSRQPEAALFWYNILMASSGTYSILFFPFTRALLKIRRQRILTICSYVACVFVLVVGILGLNWRGVSPGRGGYWIPVLNTRWLYVIVTVSYFFWCYGIFNLIRGILRESSPVQRNRLIYVLLGAVVVMIGVPTNFTVLRDYPVDISLNLVSALIIGYAVVRHRLLDIRAVLVRSFSYSVLTAALVVGYLGIVVLLERLLKQRIGYTGPASGIIAILFIAFIFLPLRDRLQNLLDRLFFREKSDYQKATQQFSREITSLYDTSEITKLVNATVAQAIKASSMTVTLLDDGKALALRASIGTTPANAPNDTNDALSHWLRTNGRPLVREEAPMDPQTRALVEGNPGLFETADVSLVVPILLNDRLMGTFNVGSKRAGTMYNDDDLRFLTTIANQTATAIEKSTVYREIQRRLSEQTLLFILSEKFRGITEFNSVMMSIVKILKNFLTCDYCTLVSFEREGAGKLFALDPVSRAAGEIALGLRERIADDTTARGETFPLGPEEIASALGRMRERTPQQRELLASFVYFPLKNRSEALGVLVVPNRTDGPTVDAHELELLRTISAILSQGIVLYRTIVNLVSVKTYNENILNSLNDMGDPLVILDLNGSIKSVNRTTCSRLGYREEDLVGRPMSILAKDGEPLFTSDGLQSLVSAGSVSNYETTYRTRDGASVPMLFSGSVMAGEDGETPEIVGIARDITERIKAEEMAKNLLLIKEIHHRIKNNLQVISSLLYLQSGYVQDEKTREMFKESQNRVRSMALLHEKLYQAGRPAGIDFSGYVHDLTRNLFMSYGVSSGAVDLLIDISGITLGMDTAVPCGLIINELVSNALKHAFPDTPFGQVHIEMQRAEPTHVGVSEPEAGNWYRLIVRDNGKGIPEGLDFRNTESLGLKLVCTLTDQLNGSIDLERDRGTRFTIVFKEP